MKTTILTLLTLVILSGCSSNSDVESLRASVSSKTHWLFEKDPYGDEHSRRHVRYIADKRDDLRDLKKDLEKLDQLTNHKENLAMEAGLVQVALDGAQSLVDAENHWIDQMGEDKILGSDPRVYEPQPGDTILRPYDPNSGPSSGTTTQQKVATVR